MKTAIPQDPAQLREVAGLSVREMSALAMFIDPTAWNRVERTGGIDPARLALTRARVAIRNGCGAAEVRAIVEGLA